MSDAQRAVEVFLEAAQLNKDDPILDGSLLRFPNYGQVVMTGDLHGHRRNFAKLKRFCNLEQSGARHVMLHEIIHEEVETLDAVDTSHELLLSAAEWKCEFPDQVHFMLSNHELAQIFSREITKNGRVVTKDFEAGLIQSYGPRAADVMHAIHSLIRSYPLAGRTENRVFLSHSLPSPRDLPPFDPTVFGRALDEDDLIDRGPAHAVVWGRYHTDHSLDVLAEMLDVDYFICGHQPQEMGHEVMHDRMIIIASEHNHGVFLPIDLNNPVDLDRLTGSIRPFASLQ